MTKIIAAYRDQEGFRQEGELVTGILYRYWDVDPKTGLPRRYGFVRLNDGSELFAHRNNRSHMEAYGTEKLKYIVRFEDVWPTRIFDEPNIGERVVGVPGKDRNGRPCLVAWSYPSELERALQLCETYVELERERIERDPRFRLERTTHILGRPDSTSVVFEGTKAEAERKFPLGSYNSVAGRPDPTISCNVGDVEHIMRWFQETETTEWRHSGDPRKMRFMLTRQAARYKLEYECSRFEQGESPIWYRRNVDEVVAIGSTPKSDQKVVSFHDTPQHLRTVFRGKDAEELWQIGLPKPKPKLEIGKACEFLAACKRTVRQDGTVEWRHERFDSIFPNDNDEDPLVAFGNLRDGVYPLVQFVEQHKTANTTFEGAEASWLWTLGTKPESAPPTRAEQLRDLCNKTK